MASTTSRQHSCWNSTPSTTARWPLVASIVLPAITATVPATTPDGSPVIATCRIKAQYTPFGPLGDVTGDNEVNISDAIRLISYLSHGDAINIVFDNADFNCDGEVNISDVTMLISTLSSGN